MKLTIDFETRSTVDLKKCGMHVYAEHPDTDVLCCAVKVDDKPAFIWTPQWVVGVGCPGELNTTGVSQLLRQADEIEAHNAGFEIAIWQGVCTPRYGWPEVNLEKMFCSAARAAMCSLPRSLDGACSALGLDIRKDKEGYALMLKMCKPRAKTKKNPGLRWHEEPDQIRRLIEYCKQDVEAEYALSQRLPNLPAKERAVWLADQEINLRGIRVDRHMVAKMIQGVDEHTRQFLEATARVTDGAVDSPKKIAASVKWLASQGVAMECMDKSAVAEALTRTDLPDTAREFLEIRQSLGKSSTAKYETLIRATCRDGRMRGVLLYHGASTGRWCLAEGTEVLVKEEDGVVRYKAVQDVHEADLLWDGVAWVHHEGVIFSGEKEVITWDGVTATKEHKVFVSDTECVSLGYAKAKKINIYKGEPWNTPCI